MRHSGLYTYNLPPIITDGPLAEAKKAASPKKAAVVKKPKGQWTVQAGAFKSKDQAQSQMGPSIAQATQRVHKGRAKHRQQRLRCAHDHRPPP